MNKIKSMLPLAVTGKTLVTCCGKGIQSTFQSLVNENSGLCQESAVYAGFDTWVGRVAGVENIEFEEQFKIFLCRNNQLAKMALDEDDFSRHVKNAISKYGNKRIGLFVGTSTSGGEETEIAYRQSIDSGKLPASYTPSTTQMLSSLQNYVQKYLNLEGPGLTISTACSSSSKVFAAAYRHIISGQCDAAIVGGVDSLCLTTLFGFNSLQLVSSDICRPFDTERKGINIGEAAGFVLLELAEAEQDKVKLKGYGESSDAYHMSAPQPEGAGAIIAMNAAMDRAGLQPKDIGYLNLHGTGTINNDLAEANGVVKLFQKNQACSSTKGFTGHTLGAAGIVEAIISIISLEEGILPANLNLNNRDPKITLTPLSKTLSQSVDNVMTNNFGFGGSNSSLIFGW